MMESKELENRKRIVAQFVENSSTSASAIAKLLKLPRSTMTGIIKRFKESLTIKKSKFS